MSIKVLYVLNSDVMGGATISFLNMMMGLKLEGVIPVVVLPIVKKGDELETILQENNVEYYRVYMVTSKIQKISLYNSVRWILKYLYLPIQKRRSRNEIVKIFDKVRPDLIHTNVGPVHEGFWIAVTHNIPHIWHIREYQTKDFNWFIYPSFKKYQCLLKQSYVVTITDDLKRYFGIDSYLKAKTIYNGIFHNYECEMGSVKESYFLMASRVSPEKGHVDAIKAFAVFSKNNSYKLKIAGFGSEKYINELRRIAKEYDCEHKIEFLGFQRDVKNLMSKAQALIVSSYNEGFGRMTAEAMFCGTIVIGRETAGTKEIINKTSGFFFNSIEDMAQRMAEIASLPAKEYLRVAQIAQKKAVELFSIESNVRNILSLYNSVLKK